MTTTITPVEEVILTQSIGIPSDINIQVEIPSSTIVPPPMPPNMLPDGGNANDVAGKDAANTGYEWKAITGTSKQILVAHTPNSISLSAPQDLDSLSSPTFATVNANLNGSANQLAGASITAKGDIIVGNGGGSAQTIPVGVNGSILTADSSKVGGVTWSTSNVGVHVRGALVSSFNASFSGYVGSPSAAFVNVTGATVGFTSTGRDCFVKLVPKSPSTSLVYATIGLGVTSTAAYPVEGLAIFQLLMGAVNCGSTKINAVYFGAANNTYRTSVSTIEFYVTGLIAGTFYSPQLQVYLDISPYQLNATTVALDMGNFHLLVQEIG